MIVRQPFGSTGHESSRVIFGAAALASLSQDEADAALPLLLEHGVNHIDTAASYGDAELRLAPWLREHRDTFFLATKTGERGYEPAREEIRRSLERMGVDRVDLIQLHCLVHPAEWDLALSDDGALRAAVEARDEGLVRFIGVTGHGSTVAEMHLRSLERFPFDSVLFPYSHVIVQDGRYASDVEQLLATCRDRGVAVQTIKGISRGRGARLSGPRGPGTSRCSSRSTSTSRCTGCSASPACSSTAPATSSCFAARSTRPSGSSRGPTRARCARCSTTSGSARCSSDRGRRSHRRSGPATVPAGSGTRLAPHRERLRDRPYDASATRPDRGHGAKPGRMSSTTSRRSSPKCQLSLFPVGSVRPSIRSRRSARAAAASARSTRSTTGIACAADVSRARFAAGPQSIWRYAELLPVSAPEEPRLAPGWTPLTPAPRLAEELGIGELWLKLDTANPTHSFKDRVVAVAARKAQELGLETLSCSSTGNLAGAVAARAAAEGMEAVVFVPADLEPEKLQAAAAYGPTLYAVNGHYDHCSRLSVELSFELPWGFVNVNLRSYYAEGSKTLAYELAEQLDWRAPDVVAIPIASGALFHKVGQGFDELRALGLLDGPAPRQVGGQAEGCQPVATAFRDGTAVRPVRPDSIARSLAIGTPADGDFAIATARATGGSIHTVPEDEIGENMALLARTTGVFGETATGVTLGALRAAVDAGEVDRDDRVVLLVTGDGLKTPGAVAHTYAPIRIEADADAFLDEVRALA